MFSTTSRCSDACTRHKILQNKDIERLEIATSIEGRKIQYPIGQSVIEITKRISLDRLATSGERKLP